MMVDLLLKLILGRMGLLLRVTDYDATQEILGVDSAKHFSLFALV